MYGLNSNYISFEIYDQESLKNFTKELMESLDTILKFICTGFFIFIKVIEQIKLKVDKIVIKKNVAHKIIINSPDPG